MEVAAAWGLGARGAVADKESAEDMVASESMSPECKRWQQRPWSPERHCVHEWCQVDVN